MVLRYALFAFFIAFFIHATDGDCHGNQPPFCQKLFNDAVGPSGHFDALASQKKRCPVHYQTAWWLGLHGQDPRFSLKSYARFVDQHPTWPWIPVIKRNAESTMDRASNTDILLWFKNNGNPRTSKGQEAYIRAAQSLGKREKIQKLKALWGFDGLTEKTEATLQTLLKGHLTPQDYGKRARLYLDAQRPKKAAPFILKAGGNEKKILMARYAYQRDENIPKVPLMTDEVLLDALAYEVRHKNPRAHDLFLKHKKRLYAYKPEATWRLAHLMIRRLLEAQAFSKALQVVQDAKGLGDAMAQDALWLEGWLTLFLHKNTQKATDLFMKMRAHAHTPVSRAKTCFWIAFAHEMGKNKKNAQVWYARAAHYPTTFYGQEAMKKLGQPFTLPRDPVPTSGQRQACKAQELLSAASILLKGPKSKVNLAKDFYYMAIKKAPSHGERLVILDQVHRSLPWATVELAKMAAMKREIYGSYAYPMLPKHYFKGMTLDDQAMVHAVIRKESNFNPRLVSSAGAVGLMQLRPSTAAMVAKQCGLNFCHSKLVEDAPYAIGLGAKYLKDQEKNCRGCQTLSLASYNAGPRHAETWVTLFGTPQQAHKKGIPWVEVIPFGETRNYVHRVLEAQAVYRHKLKKRSPLN